MTRTVEEILAEADQLERDLPAARAAGQAAAERWRVTKEQYEIAEEQHRRAMNERYELEKIARGPVPHYMLCGYTRECNPFTPQQRADIVAWEEAKKRLPKAIEWEAERKRFLDGRKQDFRAAKKEAERLVYAAMDMEKEIKRLRVTAKVMQGPVPKLDHLIRKTGGAGGTGEPGQAPPPGGSVEPPPVGGGGQSSGGGSSGSSGWSESRDPVGVPPPGVG